MKTNMESRMEGLIPDMDLNATKPAEDTPQIKDYSFDEEFAAKVTNYNNNITQFGAFYENFIPSSYRLVVRGYTKEMTITEEGIVIPNREALGIPTKANQRTDYDTITDPYGFTNKCVVVNVGSDVKEWKTGDVVILSQIGSVGVEGAGGEIVLKPAGQFVDPESGLKGMPEDPASEHFGYFLITTADVLGCLKK